MSKDVENNVRLEIVKEIVTSRLVQNIELKEQDLRSIMETAIKQANSFIQLWNEMGTTSNKPFSPNSFIKR